MSIGHGKLDISASTRLPPEWNEIISESHVKRATWIREAVKQRLIAENLIQSSESNFSHDHEENSKNTLSTLFTRKNTSVFKSLLCFFSKNQAQKKTDGNRSYFAHSSQG